MERVEAARRIASLLQDAVIRSATGKPALLFSGGVDSTTIAVILKRAGVAFRCFSVGFEGAEDTAFAAEAAAELGLPHEHVTITLDSLEKELPLIAKTIPDNNAVKTGVGAVMWFGMRAAEKAGFTSVITGLGSEELFAGYERHALAEDVNKACREGLAAIKGRDLDRDEAIARHFSLRVALPFLDPALVEFAMQLPGEWKLSEKGNKLVLREAAAMLGVPDRFAFRKKRAAQYGSKADWALEKLARKHGFKFKSGYVGALS